MPYDPKNAERDMLSAYRQADRPRQPIAPERTTVNRAHPSKPNFNVSATAEEHASPRRYEERFNATDQSAGANAGTVAKALRAFRGLFTRGGGR